MQQILKRKTIRIPLPLDLSILPVCRLYHPDRCPGSEAGTGARTARTGRRRERGGFTLIEVLAALVILSMILTVVGTILVTTLRTQRSIEDEFRQINPGTAILNIMSRDLQSAFTLKRQRRDRRFFYGENRGTDASAQDQLDFVTSRDVGNPEEGNVADYSECGYLLKPNDDAPGLYRLYRRSSPWIDEHPIRGGTLTQLHDRVVSLNIEYSDPEASEESTDPWLDSWDDRERSGALPERVRITLVMQFQEQSSSQDDEAVRHRYRTVVSIQQ